MTLSKFSSFPLKRTINNFSSPKDLVDYLDYLDNNSTAYMEYHQPECKNHLSLCFLSPSFINLFFNSQKWRVEPEISDEPAWTPKEKMTCGICRKLKELKSENYPTRILSSALEWWWGGMGHR